MKIIPVKMYNKSASVKCMVDDWDYTILSKFSWNQEKWGYAYRKTRNEGMVKMHRAVCWCPKNQEIDHKDGDKLNNQEANLRPCTRSQNEMNKKVRKDNACGITGVRWHKRAKKWMAEIKINQVSFYLGLFTTKEEAAQAYTKKAELLFGEFKRVQVQPSEVMYQGEN